MGILQTNGNILKKKLGLESLKNVYICKVLNLAAYNFYFIVYDTRYPFRFVSNYYVLDKVFPAYIAFHNATRKSDFSPLIRLEKYDGSLRSAMFFVLDLAGRYGNPEALSFVFEKCKDQVFIQPNENRFEETTLANLKTHDAMSSLTKDFQRDRVRQMHGHENRLAKLIDVEINKTEDWVTFKFLTPATGAITPDQGASKGQTEPPNMAIVGNPSKTYEIHIRILKFFSWLFTKPDLSEITRNDVDEILKISDIQLWSNSPSFWWQGMAWNLTQLDASIEPCTIAPKFWNQGHLHGDSYFLDKHTGDLLMQISFFLPQMAAMLTKRLKAMNFFGGSE